jgi:hypothetical protein
MKGFGGTSSGADHGDVDGDYVEDSFRDHGESTKNVSGSGGDKTNNGEGKLKKKRKSSRLISYVSPEGATSDESKSNSTTRRKKIGQLGVDLVVDFEKKRNRDAIEMDAIQANNKGFDVKSVDNNNLADIRYIEVKATSGLWDSENPAQMHKKQFEMAQEYGENYWLYVVEQVESADPKIYRIQNPANRVDAFMFDHGWIGLGKVSD